jgi:hypothetical protein
LAGRKETDRHLFAGSNFQAGPNLGTDLVAGGLELPESDVDGDTTLTLGLELVKNPGVLERGLAELGSLLLELLDGTLVDTTALVDKVAGGLRELASGPTTRSLGSPPGRSTHGRLAGVDVADNDDVDVELVLAHFEVFCTSSADASELLCEWRGTTSAARSPPGKVPLASTRLVEPDRRPPPCTWRTPNSR